MRRSLHATILAALVLALATPALAQRTTGGISGTVKDASGAVLPGVTVSVSGPNIVGTQTAVTNEQGFYRFINLPPGDYQLAFSLTGFRTVTRRGLRVAVGGTIEENPALEVRQLQESVEVVGTSSVVDTTSNQVGANYGREWVDNAPLRRNSFFDLVAAAPGVAPGRRLQQHPAHHGLRLLLRRELVPGGRCRHHRQLLQRGARRAEHGRDRGGRGPLARCAGRVREPDRRRLQHRHPPGDERVPRRRGLLPPDATA